MIVIWILVSILIISAVSVLIRSSAKKSTKKISLGRDDSCDIHVDISFEDVSRVHASIFLKDNLLVFEDNSSNGSYVNEQKVHQEKKNVSRKDQIKLGESYIVSWDEIAPFFPDFFLQTKTSIRKN